MRLFERELTNFHCIKCSNTWSGVLYQDYCVECSFDSFEELSNQDMLKLRFNIQSIENLEEELKHAKKYKDFTKIIDNLIQWDWSNN